MQRARRRAGRDMRKATMMTKNTMSTRIRMGRNMRRARNIARTRRRRKKLAKSVVEDVEQFDDEDADNASLHDKKDRDETLSILKGVNAEMAELREQVREQDSKIAEDKTNEDEDESYELRANPSDGEGTGAKSVQQPSEHDDVEAENNDMDGDKDEEH